MSEYHHGLSFPRVDSETRTMTEADMNTVAIGGIAGDGVDSDVFPPDEPVQVYTYETEKLAKLGAGGTLLDAVNGIIKQGIAASLIIGRVEDAGSIEGNIAKLVGSAASQTGVNMFKYCASYLGEDPDIIISPGFTSQRIDNNANPVVAETIGVCDKLLAVTVADGPDSTREAALEYRQDFDSSRLIIVDPHVKLYQDGETIIQPASAFVAGLGVKRDKEKGSPFHSWSNQTIQGISGISRPISYFIDDPDSEANYLNSHQIATIYRETGGSTTGYEGGFTFWGNESASNDTLWRFYSVQRGRDYIVKTIRQSLKPFIDNHNVTAHAVVALWETLDRFLRNLIARGDVIDGKIEFDPTLNSYDQLRSGKVRIEFKGEEAPPMQHISVAQHRYEDAYETLISDVLREIETTSIGS